MHHRTARAALTAIAALVAACAAPAPTATTPLPRHVAPTAGPTAKLVMRGTVPQGDIYGVYVLDDAVACNGLRLAGAGNATRVPVSTALAADRLTTLDYRIYKADKRSCLVRWSFTPAAGRSYLVSGGLTATGCSARLLDATDPDAIKPVDGVLVRNTPAQACVGLNEARASNSQRALGGQSGNDAVLLPGAGTADLEGLLK